MPIPAFHNPHFYLIGLTGNIACGKSTVVAMLRERGAHILDADAVTRELQQPGQAVYQAIVDAFGSAIVQAPGGPINRKALGAIVFGNSGELRRLEAIVHPAVRARIAEWTASLTDMPLDAQGRRVAVIDAIKLLEGGWKAICDAVWVVTCEREQQHERLVSTRGMSETEALQRIDAQSPQHEKIAQADVVIDNSGALAATAAQVDSAFALIPPVHSRASST